MPVLKEIPFRTH